MLIFSIKILIIFCMKEIVFTAFKHILNSNFSIMLPNCKNKKMYQLNRSYYFFYFLQEHVTNILANLKKT